MTLIDIFNRALDFVGTQSIQTIADTSIEARLCNRNWDASRRGVLRIHPWNFAITRVALVQDTGFTPAFDFQYAFTLPADFIRLTKVDMEIDDWRIERTRLITDSTSAKIGYVADITDPNLYDPLAADAMSLYLAWFIAYKITQSNTLKDQIFADWVKLVSKARFVDSSEDPKQDIDIDVWMRSRVGPSQGFVRDPMT